jgi:hypothetical protein
LAAAPFDRNKVRQLAERLPRWAKVVLAARTARRLQPLLVRNWPKAPSEVISRIEQAIAMGEFSAAKASQPPPERIQQAAKAVRQISRRPDLPGLVCRAIAETGAHTVETLGSPRSLMLAVESAATTAFAARFGTASAPSGLVDPRLGILEDAQELVRIAEGRRWTDQTPVPPGTLRPIRGSGSASGSTSTATASLSQPGTTIRQGIGQRWPTSRSEPRSPK